MSEVSVKRYFQAVIFKNNFHGSTPAAGTCLGRIAYASAPCDHSVEGHSVCLAVMSDAKYSSTVPYGFDNLWSLVVVVNSTHNVSGRAQDGSSTTRTVE